MSAVVCLVEACQGWEFTVKASTGAVSAGCRRRRRPRRSTRMVSEKPWTVVNRCCSSRDGDASRSLRETIKVPCCVFLTTEAVHSLQGGAHLLASARVRVPQLPHKRRVRPPHQRIYPTGGSRHRHTPVLSMLTCVSDQILLLFRVFVHPYVRVPR